MKARVLKDCETGVEYTLIPDNRVRDIGRHHECHITTEVSDDRHYTLEVSRKHANIECTVNGLVFIAPIRRISGDSTIICVNEERIYKTTQIFPGQKITFGSQYNFILEERDLVAEERKEGKLRSDTTESLTREEFERKYSPKR